MQFSWPEPPSFAPCPGNRRILWSRVREVPGSKRAGRRRTNEFAPSYAAHTAAPARPKAVAIGPHLVPGTMRLSAVAVSPPRRGPSRLARVAPAREFEPSVAAAAGVRAARRDRAAPGGDARAASGRAGVGVRSDTPPTGGEQIRPVALRWNGVFSLKWIASGLAAILGLASFGSTLRRQTSYLCRLVSDNPKSHANGDARRYP